MHGEGEYLLMRSREEAEAAERARSARARERHRELAELYEQRARAFAWNSHRR